MIVIDYRDWPKPTPRRHTALVASFEANLDEIAAKLFTKPKSFIERARKLAPQMKYRCIFLCLSNGAPAMLLEDADVVGTTSLYLQELGGEFSFEDDFDEVVSALKLNRKKVRKSGEFMTTWLPDRKVKRVKYKEEPIRGDWWDLFSSGPSPIATGQLASKKAQT